MKLEFEDITLKLIRDEDSAELFQLTEKNRSYLREWLPWLDMTQKEDDTKQFIKLSKEQYSQKKGFQFMIRKNGVLVGIVGLINLDLETKKTGIGYWLDREYQGQAIITKSCKLIINYCIEKLKLNTFEISCAVENYKSKTIPVYLGFKKEKTVKNSENHYGKMVDLDIYILNKDFPPYRQ